MKHVIVIGLFVGIILSSCTKSSGCNGFGYNGSGQNPCDDGTPCEDYPGINDTISLMGYNTCTQMYKYFHCHRGAEKDHTGDTLHITGWIDNSDPYGYNYALSNYNINWVMLTDDSTHYPRERHSFYIELEEAYDFSQTKGNKLFATGIFVPLDKGTDNCCGLEPRLIAFIIDTISHNE